MKKIFLFLVIVSFLHVSHGQTAGVKPQVYTLGGVNPSFPTVDSMKRFLYAQPVAWPPIVVKVRSGKYGPLVLDTTIFGCSKDNYIRLEADSGATPVFDGGAQLPGLTLRNCAGWKFEGLVFGNLTDGVAGVRLEKNVFDVTFRNCSFYAMESDSVVEKRHCGLISDQALSGNGRNICLIGNTFRGGWANIYLNQPAKHPDSVSFFIDSNRMYGAKRYGMACSGCCNVASFSCNTVESPVGAADYTCLSMMGEGNRYKVGVIGSNMLTAIASKSATGISLGYFQGRGYPYGLVRNNAVYTCAMVSTGIRMYPDSSQYDLINNTVFSKTISSYSADHAVAVYMGDFFGSIYNNVLMTEGYVGMPLYYTYNHYYSYKRTNQDYNCYYHASGCCLNGTTLSSLKSRSDYHSIFKPFPFPKDSAAWLNADYSGMICPRRTEVENDMNGTQRDSMTVMGALQPFMLANVDLSLSRLHIEEDLSCRSLDTMHFSLEIKECGIKEVCFSKNKPIEVEACRNGMQVARYRYESGCLKFLERDTLDGLVAPVSGGVDKFCFILHHPDDNNPDNDTLWIVVGTGVASVPFEVDFSSSPVGMFSQTSYGQGGWKRFDSLCPLTPIVPYSGSGMLVFSNETGQPCIAQTYWKALSLENTLHPKLGFWHACSGHFSGSDMLAVKVTSDGGGTFTQLGQIVVTDSSTAWKYYEYDLSGFVQDGCLSVVLEAVSFSDAVQCLDDVSITIEQDLAVDWVKPALDSAEICGLRKTPLQVVLQNMSGRPLKCISDTLSVRVGGAANRSYYMTYSNTLAAFASDTLVMDSTADFSVQGDYFVEVCCQSVDCNTANDTLRDSVRVDAGFSIDSVSVVSAQGVIVQGGSFRCGFRIRNTGNTAIAYPKVVLEINEDIRWSAKLPFCLGAGDSVWFDIAEPISVPAVSSDQPFFMLILSVSQPCVADTFVQQSLFEVFLPDSASLGLACFLYPLPSDTLVYGSKVVPRVRILNDGNVAVRSLPVSLRLYDGERMPYDSVTCFLSYLLEKDTVDFTFSSGCKVPSGSSRCLLQVFIPSLDSNAADDTLEVWCPIRMVTDTTAVPDWKGCGWQLGQNIPNPAAGRTLVPVTLPEAGAVRLQLFAADGRLLYRCELELPSGKSLLPLETGRYASGVYFYSVEYKGERKVRKMQVVE